MSSRSLRPSGRKIGAAALSATLGLAGLGMVASPAAATEATTSERLAGIDRYATAVDISQEVFTTSDDVVLARGDVYADALAGNGVAGAVDAPILLTQSSALDPRTAAEIERLGAGTVYIMGGTEAISESVETALEADYTVVRIDGVTRIETAVEAAEFIAGTAGGIGETNTDQTTAILVNGYNFPDAVSASPAAYNQEIPVLLTTSNDLSDQTAAALTALGIERVLIVGGTDAVSAAVETEVATLVDDVERFAGLNRYSTATDFATDFLMAELGWDGPEYDLATGEKFADALTGGPHAGTIEAPILLTQTETLSEATEDFLTINCEIFDEQIVLGGTAAVSNATEAAAQAAAQCDAPATNQSFAVTPDEDATVNEGAAREFTFSDIDAANLDIQLAGCDDVDIDEDGNVSFRDADNDGDADFRAVAGYISAVNGVALTTNANRVNDATVVDGELDVTVQSTGEDCIVVVVFDDADDDNLLDLDADDMPTEDFAIAPNTVFATATAVDATPETDLNPYGSQHTVTAQLRTARDTNADGVNNPAPVAGETIRFQVIRGATVTTAAAPNQTASCAGGTVVSTTAVQTDANGTATFTYTGPTDPSAAANDTTQDCILVFWDRNNNGVFDTATESSDTVAKQWTDAPAAASTLDAAPEQDTNPVSTNHAVTATVANQFGQPVANETVRFEVYREIGTTDTFNRVVVATRTTGADGVATFIYTGPAVQADDEIIVCSDNPTTTGTNEATAGCAGTTAAAGPDTTPGTADDVYTLPADQNGTNFQDSVLKFWVATATAADQDAAANSCVVGFDKAADAVDVERTTGDNLRYGYDGNDQYFIGGAPTDQATFETNLTVGDRIEVNYEPGGVSVFRLTNDTDCDAGTP